MQMATNHLRRRLFVLLVGQFISGKSVSKIIECPGRVRILNIVLIKETKQKSNANV